MVAGARWSRSSYSPGALSALWVAAVLLYFSVGPDQSVQAVYVVSPEKMSYDEAAAWCVEQGEIDQVEGGGHLASIPRAEFEITLKDVMKKEIKPTEVLPLERNAVSREKSDDEKLATFCNLPENWEEYDMRYNCNPAYKYYFPARWAECSVMTGEVVPVEKSLVDGRRVCAYINPCSASPDQSLLPENWVELFEDEAQGRLGTLEWKGFIGLEIADKTAYADHRVLWKWMDGVPYSYTSWFSSEPDHVNAANGLDPDMIGVAITVVQSTAPPGGTQGGGQQGVDFECEPATDYAGNDVLGGLPRTFDEVYWGDIDKRGGYPDANRVTAQTVPEAWNIHALCKLGNFDRHNCSADAEFAASNCHTKASCEYDFVNYFCTCPAGWTTFNRGFGPKGCVPPPVPCSVAEGEELCKAAELGCWKTFDNNIDDWNDYECCTGGDARDACEPPLCEEDEGKECHALAYCDRAGGVGKKACICPEGAYGNGLGEVDKEDPASDAGCSTTSWSVRVTISVAWITPGDLTGGNGSASRRFLRTSSRLIQWQNEIDYDFRGKFARIFYGLTDQQSLEGIVPPHFLSSMHHDVFQNPDTLEYYVTVNALFKTKAEAVAAESQMEARLVADDTEVLGVMVNQRILYNNFPLPNIRLVWGPNVYTWVLGTTSDELQNNPTGLQVDNVYFSPNCLSAGCWIFDVTYATGEKNFNVWYLPRSDNDDAASYDTSYAGTTLEDTYLPVNFPCGSTNYDPDNWPGYTPDTISSCCIPAFVREYRAASNFTWGDGSQAHTDLTSRCAGATHTPPIVKLECGDTDVDCWDMPGPALSGHFPGMPLSYVESRGAIDPYIGQYKARFYMDEVELRQKASMLAGTVGVEYTVRTFVGLAEFKPTETAVLDMFTKQVDIYLEKTSFMSVSTHGTNDYTFLQYVNMRLVEVLDEDSDNTDDAATATFIRTGRTNLAHYVQVTFTLGAEYEVKNQANRYPLIPLDSVRVTKGAFADDANMMHACDLYAEEAPDQVLDSPRENIKLKKNKNTFNRLVAQPCGPRSSMCSNPSSIPDSFVSFNVPLGLNWLPLPSNDLSRNVFVSLVVQAQNKEAMKGAGGTQPFAANITKTTLNAAIPVVLGGVNIFCDGITAKTDLKDVARTVIVFGSAGLEDEITRLRIIGESNETAGAIASSVLDPADSTRIDTDSIESAIMTLVVLGNAEFFDRPLENGQAPEASSWGMELEDAMTIHVMESAQYAGFDRPGSKAAAVLSLIEADGDELYDDNNTLRTDGYLLNGAFEIEIVRAQGRARLHPSAALLQICAFSARRPTTIGSMPQSCIIRREVAGRNVYPKQNGRDFGTTIELPHCGGQAGTCLASQRLLPKTAPDGGGGDVEDTELFMTSIFRDSSYARELGRNYSALIADRYQLDDRYKRAWWINPGYEWTPTQTGGAPIFQVSQKLFFFALLALNEKRAIDTSSGGGRRRMLLAGTKESPENSALSSLTLDFDQDSAKLLAVATKAKTVVSLEMKMLMSQTQLCMSEEELREDLRATLFRHLAKASSGVTATAISNVVIDANGFSCGSRRSTLMSLGRKLLATYSSGVATVETLVAYDTASPVIDKAVLLSNPDVLDFSTTSSDLKLEGDGSTNAGKANGKPGSDTGENEGSNSVVAVAVGVAAGAFVMLATLAGFLLYKRKKNAEYVESTFNGSRTLSAELNNVKANPVSIWNPSTKLPEGLGALYNTGPGGAALEQELASTKGLTDGIMATKKSTASMVSAVSANFGPVGENLLDITGDSSDTLLHEELAIAHRRRTGEIGSNTSNPGSRNVSQGSLRGDPDLISDDIVMF